MFTVGYLGFGLIIALPLLAVYAVGAAVLFFAVFALNRASSNGQQIRVSFGRLVKCSIIGWAVAAVGVYALFAANGMLQLKGNPVLNLLSPWVLSVSGVTYYRALQPVEGPAVSRRWAVMLASVPPVFLLFLASIWNVTRRVA